MEGIEGRQTEDGGGELIFKQSKAEETLELGQPCPVAWYRCCTGNGDEMGRVQTLVQLRADAAKLLYVGSSLVLWSYTGDLTELGLD